MTILGISAHWHHKEPILKKKKELSKTEHREEAAFGSQTSLEHKVSSSFET